MRPNGEARKMMTAVRMLAAGAVVAWGVLAAPLPAQAAKKSVLSSSHNLSASGPGSTKFTEEKRVCIFCHAPHNSEATGALWNRGESVAPYTRYESSTLKANVSLKPTGASKLCLSCHDGTIALNRFGGSSISGDQFMPGGGSPTSNPTLGSDLSDDHPISFVFDDNLAMTQGELATSGERPAAIRLSKGSVLECTACHDPHDDSNGNFLVIANGAGSPLCVACHKNNGWENGAHNPANTPALADACMNCHYSHNAPGPEHLLHYLKEEDNCFINCHNNAGPPSQDLKTVFGARSRHPIDFTYTTPTQQGHKERETLPASVYHVECVDCHNPHQAKATPTGSLSGALAGVLKDNSGAVATAEYQICFNCHAGIHASEFAGKSEPKTNRIIYEPDQFKRFDTANVTSFHPVMGARRGNGDSLLVTLRDSMLTITCASCHSSDQSVSAGGAGPNGPHGSSFDHILMARYYAPTPTEIHLDYNASLYDLCYRCHREDYIMGTGSGFTNAGVNEHVAHVQDPSRKIPCFACHDPHGIPGTPSITTSSHLINFCADYVSSTSVPPPSYTATTQGGSCTVSCHPGGTRSYQR